MVISDGQFRASVVVGGILLVASITAVRFCGSVALPPKPPPPATAAIAHESQAELLSRGAASPAVYRDFLAKDAAAAGVGTPTIEEMSRAFPYQRDDGRHVLEVGEPPIALAGLELRAIRTGDAIGLEIRNRGAGELAYHIATSPTPNVPGCSAAAPLPFDAMVLGKGELETRVECVWRDGMSIVVTRVESMALPPLAAWYLGQVPPAVVGIEDRIARGHRGIRTREPCAPMVGQAVRSGLEREEIGWRDLADFYARHRCQTYQFPLEYRAFKTDGERSVPVSATDR